MHPSLETIREVTQGTEFENELWLVGGAVRDELLGLPHANDFDLVTIRPAGKLANLLHRVGVATYPPVTFERFGTAMVRVGETDIEIVTGRKESYTENSRKPTVEPATYLEDALRRDFTINTLMRGIHSERLWDPLNLGLKDLEDRVLRTPVDPIATFFDDPLRMLRAVRFRWRFDLTPAPGLYEAIAESAPRLQIISAERIREEWMKMLSHPTGPNAMQDLMDLGLLAQFAPEFLPMVDCEQGKYHHLDVWHHTLLVLQHCGASDPLLALAALLHDVGKPSTRTVDEEGNTRFFSHEAVGAKIAEELLKRLRFPLRDTQIVTKLVRNHMRLGSAPVFTPGAARRVLRDLGDQTERLLQLVEADTLSLRPGVKVLNLDSIREEIHKVGEATPRATLESPLDGQSLMRLTGLPAGREIGKLKALLVEKILEGELLPGDVGAAEAIIRRVMTGILSGEPDRPGIV